jgi:hypothetical protein
MRGTARAHAATNRRGDTDGKQGMQSRAGMGRHPAGEEPAG